MLKNSKLQKLYNPAHDFRFVLIIFCFSDLDFFATMNRSQNMVEKTIMTHGNGFIATLKSFV